ncbi:MAG TPA: Ig-like domain repeat protein [Anaerolineales bacterium]|nr:Ig-like domain repeat protein [Anaerolineales bacterium]
MKTLKFPPRKTKAQAMVEFAIVLPILLLVVYGLIEAGRLLFIYSSVINATRQAVRYGSASGIGPNGVERYRDCAGIRAAAQRGDFLNAFDDTDITIEYDRPTTANPDPAPYDTCDGNTDTIAVQTGDRVTVRVRADYNAIFPRILPFLSRTVANGNPIIAESSRTLLLSVAISPPLENTVTIITAHTPDPSQIGQSVTVSVTVTASTTPTGTVQVTAQDGTSCTITLSAGSGSCVVTFNLGGTKTITASYSGDSSHKSSSGTATHTVAKWSTKTTITTSPNPSLPGNAVTITVNVENVPGTPPGTPTPTGTVQITGSANCTITLSNGTGTCSTTFAATGSYQLTATYNETSTHASSNATTTHYVLLPPETVTLITADTPDPSQVGQNVTVSVLVIGHATPSGTVTVTGADSSCTITLSGGSGTCTVVFNSAGIKTLTATYGGDADQTGSSDTESHTVELAATTTTITADTPEPSTPNQPVTVTVVVSGGPTTPTGTVTISGADTNCTITLAGGTGSCNVVFNTIGTKTLTATYNGDTTHAPSNDTESHTVASVNCTAITHGPLTISGGNMSMTITNPTGTTVPIQDVTVWWNHDTGRSGNRALELNSASLGVTFWTGNVTAPTYTITPTSLSIPVGTSTITFKFRFNYANQDGTERILINLAAPGCELYPIDSSR